MDLNEHELAELEERLYSRIHHAAEGPETHISSPADTTIAVSTKVPSSTSTGTSPSAAGPVRLVTDKSVINNARQTASVASSKIKRYWDSLQQQNSRMSYPGISKPRRTGPSEVRDDGKANVEEEGLQTKKVFTPYKSILGSLGGGGLLREDGDSEQTIPNPDDKQKRKKSQKEGKQNSNSVSSRSRKLDQYKKLKGKKSKALKSRQKAAIGEQRLVATIDLDTSSEEEGEYVSPDPIKQEKMEQDAKCQDLHEDSDPDEVVLIPTAPPPLVCIEDSEDDGAKHGFTQPKSKKKKQTKKINSPRCISPSNSSIMSDDFIGQSDRTRLNDSFIEGLNNDEELDCTAPHTVGSLLAGERRVFGDISREARAPSISSDCTVATSSDTTDPDKRNGLKSNQSTVSQEIGAPKLSSTPKQTLAPKKTAAAPKASKIIEDDSIYAATSTKKTKPSAEKRPSSESSDESEGGNISSHSKRSKSYQSDTSTSTKSLLKRRKKRRKQDSEHYSDEDFASMLTDIVQAISENEEDSSNEEEPQTQVSTHLEKERQTSVSSKDASTDQPTEVIEVEPTEPPTQINLPQIEKRVVEIAATETNAQEETENETDSVVEVESALPPVVSLVDEESCDRMQPVVQQEQEDDDMFGVRRMDHDPECGWNDEMRKFYNDSWNCEDFNISTVLFNMPRWPPNTEPGKTGKAGKRREEDSSNEEEPQTQVSTPLEKESQTSVSSKDASTDQPTEVIEVEPTEPPTQINLPQIEKRVVEIAATETNAQEETENETDSVVEVESALPPVVSLVDEESCDRMQPVVQQEKEDDDMFGVRRMDHDPECGWNDEMRKFYNDSWNCEDFNISTVLFNMPRSNKYWPIVHKDKYPDPPKKEIICNNCGERGHMRYKCRNPPKPKTCYMCGLAGHQEVRCPNTLCLKCGEKTKNFLRGCPACVREQNMTCHLCGIRGHGQRNCPDKWRRYHSTTEDNKPLTQQYVRNPNAKHCCICSRAGHQAHMCNAAYKIFGQMVPTTEIKSYQPLYHMNEQLRQQNQNQGPKFNLFSDMTDYQLNFDKSFAANENSFYYRFAKSVGIIEEKKRQEEKLARKLKREARKRRKAEGTQRASNFPNETVVIDDDSKDVDLDRSKVIPMANSNQAKPTNEDSNYSFSEFYEDNTANLPQPSGAMPDFIPLNTPETAIAPVPSVEHVTDAKIFLTKPHAKILLGPIGAAFLKDASSKFSLKVSILFQTVGNVLLANGLSTDQDNFHNELVKFLNNASHQNEQLKLINNVPKATEKTIRYITDHLVLLTRSYENAKVLFKRYQHFEEQGANTKTCDKIRRTLNIILFGQYGLRAGREHLTKLQSNLKHLQDTEETNVSSDFRDEINQHIRYIFTSFDHADYGDILNEFEKLRKVKKLIKIKPEELNLPALPPLKAGVETTNKPLDDSFNLCKDLNFDERSNNTNISDTLDEDLILNTSDQLIDANRSSANYDDQLDADSDQSRLDSFAIEPIPNVTPKQKKHSSQKHRTGYLLEQCSHMVKRLNIAPITEKFERIANQTRRGHLSKANHRALVGIHSLLLNKLNRKSYKKKGGSSV